jgi:hypothetical protein
VKVSKLSESAETITIDPCPNCDTSGGHVYAIRVDRQFVMGLIALESEKVVNRSFRVTFTCPVNARPFAATLHFRETSLDRIQSIGKPELRAPMEAEEESSE